MFELVGDVVGAVGPQHVVAGRHRPNTHVQRAALVELFRGAQPLNHLRPAFRRVGV